ncbi:transposase [Nitrospirillum sp. BR 11164]|uniref:transposase n=1 Tax=Nitrospirillum sp. BR 11164 TaxID=3104324 RepID=UPI002AFF7117|nr:transposase [Nitrospirillum sp. BR 11164]MEA1648419.1 transposase [Nitrospirillum sp. BR 11164]
MAKHRVHSIAFKRQVVAEYAAGEALYGLARRHGICRNLIRVWVAKAETGEFDEEVEASNLLAEYEGRIAALERLVGRQALEIEFLKGALKHGRSSKSGTTSVIAGPPASASPKAAG